MNPRWESKEMRLSLGLLVFSQKCIHENVYHVCKHFKEDLPSADKSAITSGESLK
jgi:hypothetical protein